MFLPFKRIVGIGFGLSFRILRAARGWWAVGMGSFFISQ
jgi:hypothetical protein